jgi:hypothetical protein
MTKEEMSIWEKEKKDSIIGWRSEWDIKPNFKVVTFDYKDVDGKKKSKVFEIPI